MVAAKSPLHSLTLKGRRKSAYLCNRLISSVDFRIARHSGAIRVFRPAAGATRVHQFNTTLCPAATVAGRISLRSLTEYFPAGKETDRLTCFDASCVPEASSTT